MANIIAAYLIFLSLCLITLMVVQHNRGVVQLLSFRNLYLAGAILFQCSSGSFAVRIYNPNAPIESPHRTGALFCLWLTISLGIFLFIYHKGWIVDALSKRMPSFYSTDSSISLMTMSINLTIIAAVLKLGLWTMGMAGINVALAYNLGMIAATGCGTVACGALAIAFVRRGFNPMMLTLAMLILVVNVLVAIFQTAGRREVVGLVIGMIWGIYYFRLRLLPASKIITWFVLLGIGPVLLLAMYSTVRHLEKVGSRSVASQIRNVIEHGDLTLGLAQMSRGQDAGDCSMWLLENHPKHIPYRHMNTLIYFVTYPVPRTWWTTKPYTTSQLMPEDARMEGVPIGDYNIGPGIVGQAAAEGGFYALVVYAIWFGMLIRLLDSWLLKQLDSPIGVMVLGSSLGNVLATPRGEMGSFMALVVMTIILTTFVVWLPTKLLWPNQAELRERRRGWLGY